MRGVRVVAVAVVLVVTSACGDDGDARSEATGGPITTEAATEGEGKAGPTPAGCTGDLVLVSSTNGDGGEETGDIVGLTTDGEVRPLTTDGGAFGPALSPDGSQVVYASVGPDGEVADTTGPYGLDLWVVDADGSDPHRILDGVEDRQPAWSPDGELIAFTRTGDDLAPQPDRIHVVAPDGSGHRELVSHDGPEDDVLPAWSPDGELLAFVRRAEDRSSAQVVVVAADGTGEQVVHQGGALGQPAWSPDGSRIAVAGGAGGDVGALTVVDLATGEADVSAIGGVATVAWAPTGRLYVLAEPPAVRDVSGEWRVAELEPDGDGVAEGRAVSAIDHVYFLYTDYRVAVAPCLAPDAPALTDEGDIPDGLTVTDPSTGEEAIVLTREQAVERMLDGVGGEPAGWADEATTRLVYGDQATNAALCTVRDAPAPVAAGEPDPDAGPPPCDLQVPPQLVWLVANAGELYAFDARSGRDIFAAGGITPGLPDVPDLAPA